MIPGPKVLVVGEPGTGKTFALRTLLQAGVEPFVILTEQSQHTLIEGIYYHYIRPTTPNWGKMAAYATRINTMSIDSIASARDPDQNTYRQFIELLNTLAKPVDDRTGREFPATDFWGPGRCLVLDNLTGVNRMVLTLTTGGRAIRSFPEWNVSQSEEEKLILALTNLNCMVIIITHPELEKDEVSGRTRVYPSALGRKLAPTLGRNFDEVLTSKRDGTAFSWDNMSGDVATKFRLLPPKASMPQTYKPLIDAWVVAGGELVSDWPDGVVPQVIAEKK